MKINITITLDKEIVEKLKEENNYSDLINREMKAYYDGVEAYSLKKLKQKQAEIKRLFKQKRKEEKEIKQKIEKIETKESKILKFVKKYPDKIIKLISGIEKERNLFQIYQNDSELRKLGWKTTKEIFKNLKGGVE